MTHLTRRAFTTLSLAAATSLSARGAFAQSGAASFMSFTYAEDPNRPFVQKLLDDFQKAARRHLPRPIFEYIAGGAEDSASLRDNRAAFLEFGFVTRVLRNVSGRSQAVELLGRRYASPFGIAPMGISALSAYRGDLVQARAAWRSVRMALPLLARDPMRVFNRGDGLLLAGLIGGAAVMFGQPLRRVLSLAEELSRSQGIDLVPGLVILVLVFTVHQRQKQRDAAGAMALAARDAEEARRTAQPSGRSSGRT